MQQSINKVTVLYRVHSSPACNLFAKYVFRFLRVRANLAGKLRQVPEFTEHFIALECGQT